jgi:hypothetical protein
MSHIFTVKIKRAATPATQEAETGKICGQGQPRQNISEVSF